MTSHVANIMQDTSNFDHISRTLAIHNKVPWILYPFAANPAATEREMVKKYIWAQSIKTRGRTRAQRILLNISKSLFDQGVVTQRSPLAEVFHGVTVDGGNVATGWSGYV